MSEQWIVTLDEQGISYGPFDDEETAQQFADFLALEVDPATVYPLRSPVRELLTWYHDIGRDRAEDTVLAVLAELPAHDDPAGPVDGGEGT